MSLAIAAKNFDRSRRDNCFFSSPSIMPGLKFLMAWVAVAHHLFLQGIFSALHFSSIAKNKMYSFSKLML